MALNPLLSADAHAKLADPLKGEYVLDATLGKFVLQVTPSEGWALENVAGLKETLADQKQKHKLAMEKLSAFGELTPETAKHAVEQLAGLGDLSDKEKLEKRLASERTQLATKYEGEIKQRDAALTAMRAEVERVLVDGEVARILAKPEVRGSFPLLIGPIRQSVKVEQNDKGQFEVRVMDRNGNPAISRKSGNNGPMALEEYVTSLRSDAEFQRAFDGTGSTGSGASGSGMVGGGGGGTAIDPKLPPTERLKLLRQRDTGS